MTYRDRRSVLQSIAIAVFAIVLTAAFTTSAAAEGAPAIPGKPSERIPLGEIKGNAVILNSPTEPKGKETKSKEATSPCCAGCSCLPGVGGETPPPPPVAPCG